MSGSDVDARAAEYVLGTLSAHEAAGVVRDMRHDPALAAAVVEWERRLGPLTRIAPPEAPPEGLWERIEARIAPAPAPAPAPALASRPIERAAAARWLPRLLGGWAAAATVAAAALLAVSLRTPAAPVMTVMLTDRSQPAWTAAFARDGSIHLAAVPPVGGGAAAPVPADRIWQLWVLPPGATAPTSLGLLPRDRRSVTVPAPPVVPVPGMLIEITLEPSGGSPTGRPTGPVQFIGRLSQPGPDT